jgi:hypothetical protein
MGLTLICIAVVTVYVLLVLARPVGTCLMCRGKRIRRSQGRLRPCRTCRATGIARMPGATAVHSLFWSVFGDQVLDRRRADADARKLTRKERSS